MDELVKRLGGKIIVRSPFPCAVTEIKFGNLTLLFVNDNFMTTFYDILLERDEFANEEEKCECILKRYNQYEYIIKYTKRGSILSLISHINENNQLKERIKQLEDELYYKPENEGYVKTLKDYQSLL